MSCAESMENVTADVVCTKNTHYVTNKRVPIYQIISRRSKSTLIQQSANITERICIYRKQYQGLILIVYICITDGEIQTSNQFLLASLISIQKKKKKNRGGIDIFWPFFVEEHFGMSGKEFCKFRKSVAWWNPSLFESIISMLKCSTDVSKEPYILGVLNETFATCITASLHS